MEPLRLLGDPAAMIAKSMLFDIRLCDGDSCAPDMVDWVQDIQIDTWVVYKKMNFTDRLAEPTFLVQDILDSQTLAGTYDPVTNNPVKVDINQVYMRGNDVATTDGYLGVDESWASIFYDIYKTVYKPVTAKSGNPALDKLLYRTQVFLTSEKISYERVAYGFLDLLGDLGGVTEVIMLVFGFFLFPISEHSFFVHAAREFYFAKT